MYKTVMMFITNLLVYTLAVADRGVVNVKSHHGVAATADRLEQVLEAKGMTLFARIDHAAGAESVGKTRRPTELVIFGNPKVGTPLMQCEQTVAIDLPQKALIWEDDAGQVWFSYNDPAYLSERHAVQGCEAVVNKISNALTNFSQAATAE